MDVAGKAIILSHLKMALLFGLMGAVTSTIAYRRGFFRLTPFPTSPVKIRYPLIGLILYLVIFIFSAPLALRLIESHFSDLSDLLRGSPTLLMTLAQIFSIAFVTVYLFLFSLIQPAGTNPMIWNASQKRNPKSYLHDFGLGILIWLVGFPIVVFFNQIAEFLSYVLFGVSGIEQIAVRYLRLVQESPFLLIVALFSILVAAPILEELVFRGFIQTYFKQKWGFKWALILSSAFFALFHLAPSQGIGNFPLAISLFTLALFLGFLYERQGGLTAPIALHMTFNSISVIRILLWQH